VTITNGYATLDEVKRELRLTTTADDPRIERAIEAASRAIDNSTSRQFFTQAATTVWRSWGTTVWFDDAQAVTLVRESTDQTSWTTVPTTSYVTNPRLPLRKLRKTTGADWSEFVEITATYGNTTIPTEIHQATIIYAVRLFKRSDTPEGVLVGDFGAARLGRMDPDVKALVQPLARKVIG
jgi:hypothetical protein